MPNLGDPPEVGMWRARAGELESRVLEGAATSSETAEYQRLSARLESWAKGTPEWAAMTADLRARGLLIPDDDANQTHTAEGNERQ